MRRSLSALLCLVVLISLFFCTAANAQLPAEEVGTAELPPPRDSWLMVRAFTDGNYIFDAEDGQMQGLVSHHLYTPALVTVPERGEIYHVDSFLTRRERGERNDVLTVVDLKTLTTKAEIDIPDKAAALPHRGHIALLGDDRHLVVYNLTPAQSVSIVDVIDREFDGEIATPGCAISLPVEQRAFLMICADGALQLIELDADGKMLRRDRSEPFFLPDQDPVFALNILTADGWLLISHDGLAYRVAVEQGRVSVSEPNDLLDAADHEQQWRPGGEQPVSVHRPTNRLYVLMHQGGVDTHAQPGTEVWVYDLDSMRRVQRVLLEAAAMRLLVSQQEEPRLYVLGVDERLRIFDGRRLSLLRIIDELGAWPGMLQLLARHD
jgi:methylamine dehydrogenase heavy chain